MDAFLNKKGGKSFFPSGYELKIGSTNVVSGTNTSANINISQDIIPLAIQIDATNTEPRSTATSNIRLVCNAIGEIASANSNKSGDCRVYARCDLASWVGYDFDRLKQCKSFYTTGTYGNWRYTFSVVMWLQRKQ